MGLVQAFPTQHALADALRKQKPFLTNKKRLSRLKRIILKERGEKALGDATDAAAKASKTVEAAHAQRDSIQGQLKVCAFARRLPDHKLLTCATHMSVDGWSCIAAMRWWLSPCTLGC